MASLKVNHFTVITLTLIVSTSVSSVFGDSDAGHPTYYNYFCHDTPVYCCYDVPQLTGTWTLMRYSLPLQCGRVDMRSDSLAGHDRTFLIRMQSTPEAPIEQNVVNANVTSVEFSAGRWVSSGRLFSNPELVELQSLMLLGFASLEEIGENLTYESLLFASCGVYSIPIGGPPYNTITEVGILVKKGLEEKYSNLTLLQQKYNRALSMANLPLVSEMNSMQDYEC